jgi:hypothetical protein
MIPYIEVAATLSSLLSDLPVRPRRSPGLSVRLILESIVDRCNQARTRSVTSDRTFWLHLPLNILLFACNALLQAIFTWEPQSGQLPIIVAWLAMAALISVIAKEWRRVFLHYIRIYGWPHVIDDAGLQQRERVFLLQWIGLFADWFMLATLGSLLFSAPDTLPSWIRHIQANDLLGPAIVPMAIFLYAHLRLLSILRR